MFANLPDISLPVLNVPGTAYQAFGRSGVVVAVPDRLRLEADPDGQPRMLLTLIRGGVGGTSTGGRLELELSIESDLGGIGRALAAQGTSLSLLVADAIDGVFTIDVFLGPAVPSPLLAPQVLPPDLLTRARLVGQLTPQAATIAARLIEEATLAVTATMQIAFRAVAPRLPLVATFNPRSVSEQLATRLGSGRTVTRDALEIALDAELTGSLIDVDGDVHAIEPRLRAQTALLRLAEFFADRAPAVPDQLQLRAPQDVPIGRERVDFRQPASVAAQQVLSLDPFSVARSMRSADSNDFVKRVEVSPVPTGRQRITLSSNLPEPIAGLLAVIADFRAPAIPPFRPTAISESAALDAPSRSAFIEVRLGLDESLSGEVRMRNILERNGEAVEISGPWRPIQGNHVILGPAEFGVPLLVIRLSPALAALATAEVVSKGTVVARLDATTRLLAIPRLAGTLQLIVRPLMSGREIEIALGERTRLDLDLATLPGFGAHRARLRTAARTQPFLVEWRADDPEQEPNSILMGPERTDVEMGWIAASPFRPGMVWRSVRRGTPGPWSLPVLPQQGLVIQVGGEE
jgi:hypothetical protein